jgi:hypothetical protein
MAVRPAAASPGFKLFDCGTALFKEDAVTAVRATDVDIDLDFLFAPCALV